MTSVDVSNDISFYSTCIDKTMGNGTFKEKKKVNVFNKKKKAFYKFLNARIRITCDAVISTCCAHLY